MTGESERYRPEPIDTSDVELPDELRDIAERLAKNAHDVWARRRLADGWSLGPRDDKAKTNPSLVPYEKLGDDEQQYDRDAVLETIKALIALGYRIER